jgi:hypothetical protein
MSAEIERGRNREDHSAPRIRSKLLGIALNILSERRHLRGSSHGARPLGGGSATRGCVAAGSDGIPRSSARPEMSGSPR